MANPLTTAARALLAARTPGEWTVMSFDDCSRVYSDPLQGRLVAILPYVYNPRDEQDARLIAAAPTLLEQLCDALDASDAAITAFLAAHDAIDAHDWDGNRGQPYLAALAALRKAVG